MLAEKKVRDKPPPVPGASVDVTVNGPPIHRHMPDNFVFYTLTKLFLVIDLFLFVLDNTALRHSQLF